MTDLARLKEAIRNYREKARIPEAYDIADALTDPSPISVEALKGMGFEGGKLLIGDRYMIDYPPMMTIDFEFWFMDLKAAPEIWRAVNPRPTTVGQLLFLLLSLEKESS